MTITTSQRRVIDLEVLTFAQSAGIGIAQVQVSITEAHTPGNVYLNLFHQGETPEKYSLLATQLAPSGVESWEHLTSTDYNEAISRFEVSQVFAELYPTTDDQDLPF